MTKDDLYNYTTHIINRANLIIEQALRTEIMTNYKVDNEDIDEKICNMYSLCNDLQDRVHDFDKALEQANIQDIL